jgi:hypothetical protein
MLYRDIIAVCSEIHTKHINTLCGQNVEFVNVKPGGTYSDHWVLKGYLTSFITHNWQYAYVTSNKVFVRVPHSAVPFGDRVLVSVY